MIKAVIYARYSSSNQTEQSIEGQIRVCTEYAKSKGLQIVGTYVDRAISGRTDNRPDFLKMIADSSKKAFEAVIVYKTDRFARNKYDSAIYKSQLKRNGVQIHYAAESIPDGPEGIILESLMEGLAEYYSAELSQKIRRGIRESALKGHVIGGGVPLGYTIAPDKSYQIDPNGSRIVQTIFEMYNKGEPNATICELLNSRGERTKSGQGFNKNSVSRIIKNEKYIGIYRHGDIVLEDSIPPIVTKEVFYLAQRELEKRTKSKQARAPRAEYLLADKLYCGHCKRKMVGVSGTGKTKRKFYYYYCPSARAKTGCDKKHVNRDWIEDLIVSETVSYILQADVIQNLVKKIHALQENANNNDEELIYFEKRLSENKKAITNILKAIESGAMTETLPVRLQELEGERKVIEGELAFLRTRQFTLSETQLEFMLNQFLEPGEDLDEYRRKIIEGFVSEVYLYDDKLLIYYNISSGDGLEASELSLVESAGFDERYATSSSCIAGRTPESTIFVFVHGFALSVRL